MIPVWPGSRRPTTRGLLVLFALQCARVAEMSRGYHVKGTPLLIKSASGARCAKKRAPCSPFEARKGLIPHAHQRTISRRKMKVSCTAFQTLGNYTSIIKSFEHNNRRVVVSILKVIVP